MTIKSIDPKSVRQFVAQYFEATRSGNAQKVIDDPNQTATGYIASLFPSAKTVKAFNSVFYKVFAEQAFKEVIESG